MREALPILEAAYDLEAPRQACLEAVAQAVSTALGRRQALLAVELPRLDSLTAAIPTGSVLLHAPERLLALGLELNRLLPVHQFRAALYESPHFWSVVEKYPGTEFLDAVRNSDVGEFGVIHAPNDLDGGLNISVMVPGIASWSPAVRARWNAVAEHLGAAWRLRDTLDNPRIAGELTVDGTLRDGAPLGPTARERLRAAVIQRERARSRGRGGDRERLWPALVDGRWTLADAFTAAGTRYVVAHENPRGAPHLRALLPRERMVLELILAGRSGKWVALHLGVSEPTVTRVLQRALRRLGAASLESLAGVRAALCDPLELGGAALAVARLEHLTRDLAQLTRAELAVARLVLEGRTTARIAALRGTSARTVSHQLSSIYRKLGIASRRELLARFA
ncbi:MAG: LuxR C-terminal-related transcriptional regulator [Deltaproteobacteria bacterium]|nr:LuxR C-terminal-related transcriptional regulator [Deltaproteobacteria bacterium]